MTTNLHCFVTTFTKKYGRATQDGILVLFATMNLLRNTNRVEAALFRCISVIRGFRGGHWDEHKSKRLEGEWVQNEQKGGKPLGVPAAFP